MATTLFLSDGAKQPKNAFPGKEDGHACSLLKQVQSSRTWTSDRV